jgi:biuret amidohydrolase
MASVAAAPYEYDFPPEATALIMIDMQRDFVEPGGFGEALGNDVSPLQRIIPTVKRLFDGVRRIGMPVIHTQEGHCPDLSDCPKSKLKRGRGSLTIGDKGPMGRILVLGEHGDDFVSELKPLPGEIVLPKPGKGAFYGTDLDNILKRLGITHLLVGGVTTEVCVQTTLREANDRGYECLLVEDATESYFPEFKRVTLEMVRAQCGIVGWTANTDQVLEALRDTPPLNIERSPLEEPALFRQFDGTLERYDDLPWKSFRDGVEILPLSGQSNPRGAQSALLRYKPCATVPAHTHAGLEHIYVLAGSQRDEKNTYRRGDLLISPTGTSHSIVSDDGCVVLAIWEKPVVFDKSGQAYVVA